MMDRKLWALHLSKSKRAKQRGSGFRETWMTFQWELLWKNVGFLNLYFWELARIAKTILRVTVEEGWGFILLKWPSKMSMRIKSHPGTRELDGVSFDQHKCHLTGWGPFWMPHITAVGILLIKRKKMCGGRMAGNWTVWPFEKYVARIVHQGDIGLPI
jgi:hypothetical protein